MVYEMSGTVRGCGREDLGKEDPGGAPNIGENARCVGGCQMLSGLLPLIALGQTNARAELTVDAKFAGGNIVVNEIDGDAISVRQDLRDTTGDWFYWYFRARGAAGRELTVRFTGSNVIGTRGPAISTDGGESWEWLGREAVDGQSFRYTVPEEADEVRFCFAIPYFERDLTEFLTQHADDPHLELTTSATTRNGRAVEQIRLGDLSGDPTHRVLLTCRHHCCEMMASYALEGLMQTVLTGSDYGRWLRENVEFLIVPFVDKDGVEQGDQGKNRAPRDHNRDYAGESIYASVGALRETVPAWSGGRLRVALDLHCPHIRGESNEKIYFVGIQNQEIWANVKRFSKVLATVQTGALEYREADNMPFGQGWNTGNNYTQGRSFSGWASQDLPGIEVASTIEIPYANVRETTVTPDAARAFGRDVARALREYLASSVLDPVGAASQLTAQRDDGCCRLRSRRHEGVREHDGIRSQLTDETDEVG